MTKINKNINVNSMGLTSNIKKSESNKEEKLKRLSEDKLVINVRQAIKRQNAILRDIKNNLLDPSHGLKKIPKPLPDLPHSGLNLKVREKKPLPPVPNKPQPQTLSKPTTVLITTSDVGLIAKQIASFKNAMNSQDDSQAELMAEQLNKYASNDKNISADTCRKFAMNVEKLARPNFNFTPEIKRALIQFASAWIAMKSAQGDAKGAAWDTVINTMALSVQKKSKEWGMEIGG